MIQKLKNLLNDIKTKYNSFYITNYSQFSKSNPWFGYHKENYDGGFVLILFILKIEFILEIGPTSGLEVGMTYPDEQFSDYDGLYYSHISNQFIEIEDLGENVKVQYENGFFNIVHFEHINKSAVDYHLKDKTWEKVIGLSND